MHLLAAKPGGISDGGEAIDLGQSPGDIVILSAADTDLQMLSAAHQRPSGAQPSLRLANLMNLSHNMSVDLYVGDIIGAAKLVIIRLLGGVNYWPYGIEQVVDCCRRGDIPLAIVPGDDQPDAELHGLSTLGGEVCHRLWQYFVHGGPDNGVNLLAYAGCLLGVETEWREPAPLLRAGIYWPGARVMSLNNLRTHWIEDAPVVAITFYRALYQAGNLEPVDAVIAALRQRDLNPLPVFVASLKEALSAETVDSIFGDAPPAIILNSTGFAVSKPNGERTPSPLERPGVPVIQMIFAGGNEDDWRDGLNGLSARDIAMNVALPEVDGRIISRAVSFKTEARFDAATQLPVIAYQSVPDRVNFVCDLAANWLQLSGTKTPERRLALIFANYPNKDGRLGNGVGLDSPASALNLLQALAAASYEVGTLPAKGDDLINRLAAGPTNDLTDRKDRPGGIKYPVSNYNTFFASLPMTIQARVIERWGPPADDPFVVGDDFVLAGFMQGNVMIGLQPARGYNIDPKSSYHDPDLVPPHGYLAFYGWLRQVFQVQAVIHMGKHGNLEWLPGKSIALSEACFPEAILGPLPHLYPFIVNDPGEGTQAKRRAQAVIVDHLTPPLTRAESYGPLAELELLVDEYYEAAGLDPRRLNLLRQQILELTRDIGLDRDAGIAKDDDEAEALAKLDNYLCDLKEMQIRDGLHILGTQPQGRLRRDLLIALSRLPRQGDAAGDNSLIRAMATDLKMTFDPLDCTLGDAWQGPKPDALASPAAWRTYGDTVERLEDLAARLVDGATSALPEWTATHAVLNTINNHIGPTVDACGAAELSALLHGLDGRFVEPGPSGAPTRGRLDVLPTGRNFYSIDSRTVPTPAAWQLGWKSAGLLIDEYRQSHGEWPRHMAISAWGTANMRTGGDDIAQALALMGAQPKWEPASRRVIGFDVLPVHMLDRPRVDVTLRISGFFRDAFPTQIDLFDSAARAIAALDESDRDNPLAARSRQDAARLRQDGHSEADADHLAAARVFGSKPGAYGAGLQALIDEKGWQDDDDLARAYLAWGGYAYGGKQSGRPAHGQFQSLLSTTQAVVQNQDNREHDLLDSDDYYQFEGGLTAAVRHYSGHQPAIYHNDHSRPFAPKIRTLEDEIGRVVRARVVNPKWIAGVMRHGYKGAFEMAATVDYLFAFAATARVVSDHHFDAVYEAYLNDDTVLAFLRDNNPAALKEMAARMAEALERGLWHAKSNSTRGALQNLMGEKT
ncbi:MAG: cobaltochelatase subunit CobN [Rhodospirillaceae bacterium]|jgi:cobaltochelatase CobN|nr:cobaltochelatase subunit CobN [Rhodospirillaceae bacterium]MBT5082451.1 cobaltochelatase subunit CobN [Rhodospirillaceae bacterium]MBT5524012.1 cobaltochelatase subunit CobN [Rhodospirillaceae bacterium]MBT5882525.1 cobaltochelatase subunit CobN [Rhodospirillaceae bacterium]MBT6591630.1 cobaltochelatase subunit CobN [Rhodospirillaceae bacterium]